MTPEHGQETSRMPNQDIPADIIDRAAKIRLACFAVDGTLTDRRLWFDADGREAKAFSVVDGPGLALLRKSRIEVDFVPAPNNAAATHPALAPATCAASVRTPQ